MSSVKEKVLEMVQRMPDDATVDDIFSEIHFTLQVDAGLNELDEGLGLSHQDVKARLTKWIH